MTSGKETRIFSSTRVLNLIASFGTQYFLCR